MEDQNPETTTTTSQREIAGPIKDFLTQHSAYYLNFSKITLDEGDDSLHFLLRRLEEMKMLISNLQLPWEKAILFIHQGACFHYEKQLMLGEKKKILGLSSQLISMAVVMMQNKKMIHRLGLYFENQINDLKALIELSESKVEQ